MAVPTSGTAVVSTPADEQILITREFDAPRALVYRAFTTPELVRRWWTAERGQMSAAYEAMARRTAAVGIFASLLVLLALLLMVWKPGA